MTQVSSGDMVIIASAVVLQVGSASRTIVVAWSGTGGLRWDVVSGTIRGRIQG